MNVSVFGLGYVGCVTAACLARDGHHVMGVDVNADKTASINAGMSPIVEPGLADLIARVVRDGHLSASTCGDEAVRRSDVVLVCVGTPGLGHGQPDLDALTAVATGIGRACAGRTRPLTVVLRSTVLPGTTASVLQRVLSAEVVAPAAPIHVAMNPEFMREGSSVNDFEHPPFVLVGCDAPDAVEELRRLFADVKAPFIHTTIRTAEMVKYVSNAFHALKICFANEVASLCDDLGVDAQEVMTIVCEDRKLNVSPAYLRPGFAFGGSCLPKDLRALLHVGRTRDVSLPLLSGIAASNDGHVRQGIDQVLRTRAHRVGVVGLAFKPTTDDLRESPMVTLVEALIGKGCDVRVYDPNLVMTRVTGANRRYIETEIPHIASLLCDSAEALVAHAQVLVFGTPGVLASHVLAAAGPDHLIVDLTHGAIGPRDRYPVAPTPTVLER